MVFPVAAAIGAGASLLGGLFGQSAANKRAEADRETQREFAQKGIQWKVADSLKAGIHPLFGLGAQTHSFAPVAAGDSIGPAISEAGQQIGRAVGTSMTSEAQATAKMTALTVERGELENELLRSQIRAMNAPGSPAGVPSALGDNSSPLKMFGVSVNQHPGFSDAQVIQDRYGDWIEGLYGLPVLAADAAKTVKPLDPRNHHNPTVGQTWSAVKRMFGY